ncbi:MAG: hypothetical protein JRF55_07045 [Deltaproteobacteria bacterium]|nr:hypothetical protein [Deltaproteobacteria bacterium]
MHTRLTPLLLALALFSLASSASAQDRRVELRFQGGVNLGVPIFLDVDRDIVKPGLSFTGWGGFDIGWVVFDFGLGLQWTGIDTNNIPDVQQPSGSEPLIRWNFSPGVRFQVPNVEAVLPYREGWPRHPPQERHVPRRRLPVLDERQGRLLQPNAVVGRALRRLHLPRRQRSLRRRWVLITTTRRRPRASS